MTFLNSFYKALILLGLFFSYTGCSTKSIEEIIETVDVEAGLENIEKINLSLYSEKVEYIILERSEPPISSVVRFSMMDSVMLISDSNCFLYSLEGKFLRKVASRGRGPGEYATIGPNTKLGTDGNIYIIDSYDMLEYSRRGDFIVKHPFMRDTFFLQNPSRTWLPVNDSLFFVQIRNDSGRKKSKAVILSKAGAIYYRFPNYVLWNNPKIEISGESAWASIYNFKGQLGFKEAYNDTLFYLNEKFELVPALYFNMGSLKMTLQESLEGKLDKRESFANIKDVYETSNYIFFALAGRLKHVKRDVPVINPTVGFPEQQYRGGILGIYNKVEKNVSFIDISKTEEKLLVTGFYNDVDGGPKFFPKFMFDEDRLIMPISAYDFKEYVASESFRNAPAKYPEKKKALEELANSLSVDDNPVLMVVTMK